MSFVDFAELKARAKIADVIPLLGLSMKQSGEQFRGPCPSCQRGGDRTLVITPSKSAYYCFAAGKGGDVIALAAHVLNQSVKDAAQMLAEHFGLTAQQHGKSTVPSTSRAVPVPQNDSGTGLQPLTYLDASHPAVEAVGFAPEDAERLGIGYSPKGIMRGLVAVPLRLPDGTLVGYAGVSEVKLPPRLQFPANPKAEAANVVKLRPKTA